MSRWYGLLLTVLVAACSGKNKVPAGVLERDKMEDVMWDMIQADQYFREYLIRDSVGKDLKQVRYNLYEKVFQIHKISKATFDKSYDYYSNHPKLMKQVFDSLSAHGNRRLQDFYKPATPALDTTIPRRGKPRLDSVSAK